MRQVCFIGDGLIQGLGDASGAGWAVRLGLGERRANRHLLVHNLGVAYETSSDIARRWRSETLNRLHEADAGGVVFSFGLFDMAEINGDGISVPLLEALANAELMISEAASIWPVLWVGPAPVRPDAPPLIVGTRSLSVSNARLRALSEGYLDIAQRLAVPFLDLADIMPHSPAWKAAQEAERGVFPSADGHQAIADAVAAWAPWQSWMKGDVSVSSLNPASASVKVRAGGLVGSF